MNLFRKIWQEWSTFQAVERYFLFFVMATAFCINFEYSITRPASGGLLITLFSAQAVPWIWLATVPLNLAVIWLYNRYLSQLGPVAMLGTIAIVTMIINIATPFVVNAFPAWILFQFAWKDIYILLMFKQLWSLIHSTVAQARAKYLYGLIYAMGTVGAVFGGLVPGCLAVTVGSEQLFFCTLPIYLFLFFCYRKAVHYSTSQRGVFIQELADKERPKGGFSIIFRSSFLTGILVLVLLMQITVGLMDFQFNSYLELNILDKDLRTEYMGQLVSITNLLSGSLQLVGSFFIIHLLGVRKSHLLIPFLLLINIAGFMAIPSFALLSFAFVFTKAIDFSLFGVIREMLYIPLKTEEKFRAKAVIDVFVYRSAKALVSLCIIGLQLFSGVEILSWLGLVSVSVLVFWIAVVWFMFRRKEFSEVLS